MKFSSGKWRSFCPGGSDELSLSKNQNRKFLSTSFINLSIYFLGNGSLCSKYYLNQCWWIINSMSLNFVSTKCIWKYCQQNVRHFNSSTPGAAYMHQWNGSALVQIMARRLFGAKPLSKPMLGHCQLDGLEQNSVKFESEFYHLHSRKCI